MRHILGIAGGPGAGKSTLAASLVAEHGPGAVAVGMDGWHLANTVLDRLGRRERKGAPDTFDAGGFVAFLARLRAEPATVWAPEFRREVEEPVAGAIEVAPEHTLVVVEGNYLLLDEPPWDAVAPLLDESWFLAPDEAQRRAWLIARHRRHGRSEAEAIARADGSDADNARLIAATAHRADRLVSSSGRHDDPNCSQAAPPPTS